MKKWFWAIAFLVLAGVFAFAQITNRIITYRGKVVEVASKKQVVCVVLNPKTVGKTSVTLSSMSVVVENTAVDLSGGKSAYVRVYVNATIK